MSLRYHELSRPIMALGLLLTLGCGPTNEENLGGQTSKAVPHQAGKPDFKSYAEVQQYQADQANKNRSAAKGKTAPAPKSVEKAPASSGETPPKSQ
jgi:hypothetical protein